MSLNIIVSLKYALLMCIITRVIPTYRTMYVDHNFAMLLVYYKDTLTKPKMPS